MATNSFLALDVGEKRVGLALASAAARLPQPAGYLEVSNTFWDELLSLLTEKSVTVVAIGLPRGLDGQETAQTAAVRAFARELASHTPLVQYFQDEAATSVQAEEELRNRGAQYNKGDVDALAATYILTDFLAEHPEV